MENFIFNVPTEIYFGKGQIVNIGNIVKNHGKKALLVYGGGSIKKIGLYDDAIKYLKESNIEIVELSGVDPNPRIETVREGVKLCRENNVDVIVPIGGGSTLDCAKVIAAGVSYEGDSWDIVVNPEKIKSVLPIITVLTLSATGSEMDPFAVITNFETNEKIGTDHFGMKPKASILDPTYTYSVSKYQTAAGTCDIMSHIFENYFSINTDAFMQDRMAEALLKTCIKYGKIALVEPENYEARANLMWASSWAINGLLSDGKAGAWTVHPIEHELSAYFDITHGVGLAIVTPHWMRYVLNENTLNKFVEYGVNVWDIDKNKEKSEIANEAINKTEDFFKSLGIPMTLKEVGITRDKLKVMAEGSIRFGLNEGYVSLNSEDVLKILESAYE